MDEKDRWHERTRAMWKKSKSVRAHNVTDITKEIKQPGGVISFTKGSSVSSVTTWGKDEKLGRWAWTTLKGKNNILTTIITGYRPCKNLKDDNSTYNQHLRYFSINNISTCPRKQWLTDMTLPIKAKLAQGEQVVLLADINENVKSASIQQWARETGLREIVSLSTNTDIPTSQRGSLPIDGIFASFSIHPKYSGYFPFGIFQSDHRALWFDVSYDHIFGFNLVDDPPSNIRRLQCQIPHVREAWKRHYKNFLLQNNLIARQIRLEQQVTQQGKMTPTLATAFEKILQQQQEGLAYADKRCRKVHCGKVPFSPELEKASTKISLWKAASKIKRGCTFSSKLFCRIEKQVGITKSLHKSLQEIHEEENKAWKEYWDVKKKATKLRKSFLTQRAEAIAEESETQVAANVYKQLLTREKQREDARKIKGTLKRLEKFAVESVEIEDDAGETSLVTNKEELERVCILENNSKYCQTHNTICMTEPLRSLLGPTGNTPFCQSILDGTATSPPGTPQYTQELFEQLQQVHQAHPSCAIQRGISESDYSEGWKIMKETTSAASITGLHFGHLKACATDTTLTTFESSVANLPYVTGYSPEQWQESVIVMIKKKAQLNHVSALRSIVLTEADFNFNNKVLGRRVIQHAEDINDIAPEQYGSRKHKSAIDQALHKHLSYDIIRQTKLPAALCSNDAKSCYDRVLHSIVSLAYRRLGVPNPPVQCMLDSIQNMKHHIRTSHGVSTITLSKTNTLLPFQGILQGNGASPTTWVIISTPLLNMLRKAGNGAKFVSPMSKEYTHLVGFAFVDDTDLLSFDMASNNVQWDFIGNQMQEAIDRWEGGLKSTGGAIVPNKSWVYPIDFKFDHKGQCSYKSTEEINWEFSVLDKDENRIQLNTVAASKGKETLGVILAPDGNTDDAFNTLLDKAKSWAAHIQSGHLTPSLVWQAANTTIMKSLQYPLPALTISREQCNKIMNIIKKGLLPKSQISKNIPHAVLFGPKEEGGLGLHHLYTSQGIMHVEKFMKHVASQSVTGKLLRVMLELSQLEVGIGRQLFSLDYSKFQCLVTDGWIKHLWQFVSDHHICLINRLIELPLPQRSGDVFLMEEFVEQGYTKSELMILNRCRIFLQVMTLADVMTGSGDSFTEHYLCIREPTPRNTYQWPRQEEPTTAMKKFWKKALRKTFDLRAGKTGYRLGYWLNNNYQQWEWFYDRNNHNLYKKAPQGWQLWKRDRARGRLGVTSKFRYYCQCLTSPQRIERATVKFVSPTRVQLTGYERS